MASWLESEDDVLLFLEREMAGVFAIRERRLFDGTVRLQGKLLIDPVTAVAELTERLAPHGYYPVLRSDEDLTILRARPAKRLFRTGPWVNIVLLLATLTTTVFVGAANRGANPFADPWSLAQGLPFAVTLLLILGVHELGHYFTARRYGITVTLPYFIPAPVGLGTFGAFIRMKSPVTDRQALFDVGIAGPLAGLCVALPAIVVGLHWSELILTGAEEHAGIALGTPLLFSLLQWLTLGPIPEGGDVLLHPVAFAGWIGLFVTALNLLPIGQLDGGHIAYALVGRHHRRVAIFTVLVLIGMGIAYWPGWLFWASLSLILGLKHPPPLNDVTRLDDRRRLVGFASLLLLLSVMTPSPFHFSES
ncbi:Peptidase family M50 [Candidatus Methylomirabilis lanthanidiphila]|uniref:Peptidase family M50 n=1 Tax=Candidatus Methylomirabilis lanthanidiphila TaxID=2211376 RepID=A0A564ZNG1_9BACT|nr:site-2 protease family protein [Candidatus Methylomirabilis lanthanidiphila]VUZ86078.1 Peptidase family M50 [Candidatus Methylomirabilis lanthanidiphila]